jgi:hypothetical protein
LEENIRKVKLSTPDYRDMDPAEAMEDFKRRRGFYQEHYEPVGESDGPHIKIINSRQFVVTDIRGYLPLKVVHFVMNLHTLPRTFFLTRHGQSEYNLLGKIGGDSGLTPAGTEYARRLADFAAENIAMETVKDPDTGEDSKVARPARLWTSTLRRTKETAKFIKHNKIHHTWDNGDTGGTLQRVLNTHTMDGTMYGYLSFIVRTNTDSYFCLLLLLQIGCNSVPWPVETWMNFMLVPATV